MNSSELSGQFVNSKDSLRVYHNDRLIFRSAKERLMPLLDYIDAFVPGVKEVVIFDRVVGNAAALLLRKASCKEVYSPLGSQYAVETLSSCGMSYHFTRVVPHILDASGQHICPMEKLSLGKTHEEFFQAITSKQP